MAETASLAKKGDGHDEDPFLLDALETYASVRARSEYLSAPLSAEDQLIQSMADASPTKWHLAHTTWFFETVVLSKYLPSYKPFDARFGYLFNSYYESLGPRHPRPQRGNLSRPSLTEVLAWRRHVDEHVCRLIEAKGLNELITLGLHHEQQHQELMLTDILHAFSCNPLLPAYETKPQSPSRDVSALGFIAIEGKVFSVGYGGDGFCFDNETPRHDVLLPPFRIAARPVNCGEYLDFVLDGGYRRPEFWLSDGWTLVQTDNLNAPAYWLGGPKGFRVFGLTGEQPLDPFAAVSHVSFYEAAAYAAWAKKRLPTEFEWEAASSLLGAKGRVWEWTRSSYDPYPGYKPFDGDVVEYNGKFMSGQRVLRGGSTATPPGHMRPSYRNFFPPAARWQFSGIRLASDA